MNISVTDKVSEKTRKNLMQNKKFYMVDSEEPTVKYMLGDSSIAIIEGRNAVEISREVLQELCGLTDDLIWRSGEHLRLAGEQNDE